jgi:hypothetical protein
MTSRKKAAKKARRAAKETKKAREKALEDWRQEYGGDYMDAQLDKLVDLDGMEAQLEQRVNDARVKMREAHRLEMVLTKCRHGLSECRDKDLCQDFLLAFRYAVSEASGNKQSSLPSCINAGVEATREKYAAVWNDVAKMEGIISVCLSLGTIQILIGRDDSAESAAFAYYFYQHVAVYLKKTQPEIKWHRIRDLSCDPHTLVSFYRKRIPCSCLDEIYGEVKSIPKTGFCDYPNCGRKVERQKIKCCTGCRMMTSYCSPACQKAHWSEHKHCCAVIRKGAEQH